MNFGVNFPQPWTTRGSNAVQKPPNYSVKLLIFRNSPNLKYRLTIWVSLIRLIFLFPDAVSKTNWLSISYKSLVHIRFNFFQIFPNSGNWIKNVKKVLRNVSEAVFERFFVIPNYGDVREEMRLLKQFLHDFEIF